MRAGSRARRLRWPLTGLVFVVLGACGSDPFALYRQITVTVTAGGGGNGQIVAADPAVQITCQDTAGSSRPSPCSNTFPDAGGGSIFTLDAKPATGSTFGGWSGGSSSSDPDCTLTPAVNTGDTAFTVGARFDVLPSGSHPKAEFRTCKGIRTSGVSVTLQPPYDGTPTLGSMGANVQVADSLQVEVGAQFIISSAVRGKTGSVTCATTAAIISDPADTVTTGSALVTIFTDVAGTPILSCNGTTWQWTEPQWSGSTLRGRAIPKAMDPQPMIARSSRLRRCWSASSLRRKERISDPPLRLRCPPCTSAPLPCAFPRSIDRTTLTCDRRQPESTPPQRHPPHSPRGS